MRGDYALVASGIVSFLFFMTELHCLNAGIRNCDLKYGYVKKIKNHYIKDQCSDS